MDNTIKEYGRRKYAVPCLIGGLFVVGLYASNLYSYLLFHTLIELFSLLVALVIFVVAWHTRRLQENQYLLFIGIASLFAGVLELAHALAYEGMGVFYGYSADLPTQLWIAYRYLFSISFVATAFLIKKKLSAPKVFAGYFVIVSLLLILIFTGRFPDCFVEGSGLTSFKIISEYVICFFFLLSLGLLLWKRESVDRTVLRLMTGAILASIASELFFTEYVSVFATANMVGHFFLLASMIFIYRAIVITGIVEPSRLLFRNLKLSEEALQKAHGELENSKAELSAMIENVPMIMLLMDRGSRVRKANVAATTFANRSQKDMLGRRAGEALRCLHSLDVPDGCGFGPVCKTCAVRRTVLDTFATNVNHHGVETGLSFGHRGKQEELTFLLSASLVSFSNEQLCLVCIEDITERKRAAAETEHLASFPLLNPNPVVEVDLEGHIRYENPAALRLFPDLHTQRVGHPWLAGWANLVGSLRQGKSVRREVTVGEHSYEQSFNYIAQDRLVRVYGLDISERKVMQERLRDFNAELEKKVAERTAALAAANAAILRDVEEQKWLEEQLRQAQKLESIGTLAGGVAHDFNNTLNVIKACASLLEEHRCDGEDITESLTIIEEAVENGSSTVKQLLTLASKNEVELHPVDPNSAVRGVALLLRQTFPKAINIALELSSDLPAVVADRNQLGQALLNISINARDAMPSGGRLTLRTGAADSSDIRDRHPEAKADKYAFIEVSDTGEGIDPEIQSRIFDPFFTTKAEGKGTGLGLSVVYGIVKNHDGFMDVESQPQCGTTFRIYLPLALVENQSGLSRPAQKIWPDVTAPKARQTVLIVEDNDNMRQLLIRRLTRWGFRTLSAANGEQAIRMYHESKREIDSVLLDFELPGISGRDVLIKVKEENPDAPVIIVSGYIEPELKSQLLQIGAKAFFRKPYDLQEIATALRSA